MATHLKWTALVMEEFYNQAEREVAAGAARPSLPTRGSVDLGKFQLAFIGWIRPLFEKLAAVPAVDFSKAVGFLDASAAHWAREKEGEGLPAV